MMPTPEQIQALAQAVWQLLDDFGADGATCCQAAKAQARIAFEPFMDTTDCPPDMTLDQAQAIMRACEQ
jgi:hypothetical protein